MTLYRITISYTPKRCRNTKWLKGFVQAKNEEEAIEKFRNEVGEERFNRGNCNIEVIDEDNVYIYKLGF